MLATRSIRLYSDSPSIKRDEETGELLVMKPSEVKTETVEEVPAEGETSDEDASGINKKVLEMLERHKKEVEELLGPQGAQSAKKE